MNRSSKKSSSPSRKSPSPSRKSSSPLHNSSSIRKISSPGRSPTLLSPSSYRKNILKINQNIGKILGDTDNLINKLIDNNSVNYILRNSDKLFERLFYPPTLENAEFVMDKILIKKVEKSVLGLLEAVAHFIEEPTEQNKRVLRTYQFQYLDDLADLYPDYLLS